MFHLSAYTANLVTATPTDVTPVPDGIMLIQNGHFVPQQPMRVDWMAGMGTASLTAQLVTPSLRLIGTPYIRPPIPALVPGTIPAIQDFSSNQVQLAALEEVEILANQASGGSIQSTFLVAFDPGAIGPVPSGPIYCFQGTSVTAAVANTWTQLAMTWQQSLPVGQYAMIGAEYIATNAQAARFTFQGQNLRPGCLGASLNSNKPVQAMIDGSFGVWGTFANYAMPIVQVLNNGTDAVHTVYVYLIRIA